jgi:uncharacterized protein
MQTSIAVTALVMGLAGGPHCIAMCGSACLGIASANKPNSTSALVQFQIGRLLGYSTLGAIAAYSMQTIGAISIQAAALRPLWTMVHVAGALMGLTLLVRAQQPQWIESFAKTVWQKTRKVSQVIPHSAPALLGGLWAFLPCGLLYSALLVAAMTSSAIDGAVVMALFALGSGVSLFAGPWVWSKLRGYGSGLFAVRFAGFSLFAISTWGLWMSIVHNKAPWCVTGS